jgi:cysteine desulfurase
MRPIAGDFKRDAAAMTGKRIYLDWNATAPLRPEAKAAMVEAWDLAGNPSSVHSEGRAARRTIEDARAVLAAATGAKPSNVIFTSGGTEANALALVPGLHISGGEPVMRLIVSSVEHPSVLAGGRFAGTDIVQIPVDRSGVVDVAQLEASLVGKPPALVSVMLANNETGVVQPIARIASIVHAAGGLLHVDAVQVFGRIAIDIKELGADLLTVSGHKIGGPKGVGALVMADGVSGLAPLITGGGQEKRRRAGTENVPGIAGFGAAVKVALATCEAAQSRMEALRNRLESGLRVADGDVVIFSADAPRLANTTLFSRPGMKAETAVIAFDLEGIAVSSGSACSSGKVQASHVLAAMEVEPALAQGALRLSLGWDTTEEDVEGVLKAWRKLAGVLGKERQTVA